MLFGKKNKEKAEAPKVKKNGRYTLNDGYAGYPAFNFRIEPSELKDEDLVCRCGSVQWWVFKAAVKEGATTLEEVQRQTGVGAGGGHCNAYVSELLDYLKAHPEVL